MKIQIDKDLYTPFMEIPIGGVFDDVDTGLQWIKINSTHAFNIDTYAFIEWENFHFLVLRESTLVIGKVIYRHDN